MTDKVFGETNNANNPNMRNIAISATTATALRSAGNNVFSDLLVLGFLAIAADL